jgi:hypothetical protein
MLRLLARYAVRRGAVRIIGGRAIPALLALDLLLLANRTRRIPAVDRTLRRTASGARDRVSTTATGWATRRASGRGRSGGDRGV